MIIFNNFQGVNFTMSKDEQAPEKEPKDRLSSYPSCCWYPQLLQRLEDIVKLLQFSALLEKVKDVVQLISVFGCCNMVRIITNFYEVKILYQKLLRFQSCKFFSDSPMLGHSATVTHSELKANNFAEALKKECMFPTVEKPQMSFSPREFCYHAKSISDSMSYFGDIAL